MLARDSYDRVVAADSSLRDAVNHVEQADTAEGRLELSRQVFRYGSRGDPPQVPVGLPEKRLAAVDRKGLGRRRRHRRRHVDRRGLAREVPPVQPAGIPIEKERDETLAQPGGRDRPGPRPGRKLANLCPVVEHEIPSALASANPPRQHEPAAARRPADAVEVLIDQPDRARQVLALPHVEDVQLAPPVHGVVELLMLQEVGYRLGGHARVRREEGDRPAIRRGLKAVNRTSGDEAPAAVYEVHPHQLGLGARRDRLTAASGLEDRHCRLPHLARSLPQLLRVSAPIDRPVKAALLPGSLRPVESEQRIAVEPDHRRIGEVQRQVEVLDRSRFPALSLPDPGSDDGRAVDREKSEPTSVRRPGRAPEPHAAPGAVGQAANGLRLGVHYPDVASSFRGVEEGGRADHLDGRQASISGPRHRTDLLDAKEVRRLKPTRHGRFLGVGRSGRDERDNGRHQPHGDQDVGARQGQPSQKPSRRPTRICRSP